MVRLHDLEAYNIPLNPKTHTARTTLPRRKETKVKVYVNVMRLCVRRRRRERKVCETKETQVLSLHVER